MPTLFLKHNGDTPNIKKYTFPESVAKLSEEFYVLLFILFCHPKSECDSKPFNSATYKLNLVLVAKGAWGSVVVKALRY